MNKRLRVWGGFLGGAHDVWQLKRTTGLTPEEYEAIFQYEGQGCPGCQTPFSGCRPDVDYDPQTLEIRGLLCRRCHWLFRSMPEDLRAISNYFKSPPAFAVLGRRRVGL